MSRFEKLIIKLLSANADQNFDFADLFRILEVTGFSVRIKEVIISLQRKMWKKSSTSSQKEIKQSHTR